MSEAKTEFVLPVPPDAAAEAVRRALVAGNWRIEEDGDDRFVARQRLGFTTIMWQRRANVALFLRKMGRGRTRVEFMGELFGFGPYPRWRLRLTMDKLRAAIDAALAESSAS